MLGCNAKLRILSCRKSQNSDLQDTGLEEYVHQGKWFYTKIHHLGGFLLMCDTISNSIRSQVSNKHSKPVFTTTPVTTHPGNHHSSFHDLPCGQGCRSSTPGTTVHTNFSFLEPAERKCAFQLCAGL
jgi:hypothetical protein